MKQYDVAIIGAGVVGASIARTLSRYALKIALLDARGDVSMGASRANSAIVHAGYDCEPGTNMARLNVRGNALFSQWCEHLDVPLMRTGSLVVAFSPEEEETLRDLLARGQKNGVPDLALISGEEARKMEPRLSEAVTQALYAPTAGITCPFEFAIACAENARANGAEWLLNHEVTGIRAEKDFLILETTEESVAARRVVNAAGVYADAIARLVGDDSFSIHPRKGEYLLLDRNALPLNTVLFQTPTKMGKGVLVSPTVHGNAYAGPTAVDIDDKEDTSVCQKSIDDLKRLSQKAVPGIAFRKTIRAFAGIRAQPSTKDFILGPSAQEPRMIHAAGICSPGLSSAPAIAEEIAQVVLDSGLPTQENASYTPIRRAIPRFAEMDDAQREAIIAQNPLYARVICRCCTVTQGEIVEAIHRGARDVDAVKRRTMAGMGRCQGGFCAPRVMELLEKEAGIAPDALTKFGGSSHMIAGYTRGEERA